MIHKLMHRNNLTKMITRTVHTQVTIHLPSSQMTKTKRILMIKLKTSQTNKKISKESRHLLTKISSNRQMSNLIKTMKCKRNSILPKTNNKTSQINR